MGGVSSITLPDRLVTTARRDTIDRTAWIAALPQVIAGLADRWSLVLGEPYEPGGKTAWVAPVRDRSGTPLVLKVGWPHTESRDEAQGLRVWAGEGAARLHAVHESPDTVALLLERCVPGTPLRDAVAGPDQDVVVAGLLRRLWIPPPPGHQFRSLRTMCAEWADQAEAKFVHHAGILDPGVVRDGVQLFRTLPTTAERAVLLCTDLHAENIVAAEREPWLVIDPKPYVGDPTYDALQHMLNCPDRLGTDPAGLARRMADLLGLESARLTAWLFARCVQEAPGNPFLTEVALQLARDGGNGWIR